MRILHTSDWHLGKTLYGKQRYKEFSDFLNWLIGTIESEEIDVLLVAGDVFDTTTPGTKAQEIYYKFLTMITQTKCRYIVITAGNHDSPSFLSAPKELLKFHNIYIVGELSEICDEVIEILDEDQIQTGIICAVPYLRDRDVRNVEAGESVEEKNSKLVDGIKNHYLMVTEEAKKIQKNNSPVIGMGHLFATGGKTLQDDGVRDLYVGSLAQIGADTFPSLFNYIALGHLHIPQILGGNEYIRYSGSPLPMGFGECKQNKIVIVADFKNHDIELTKIEIPHFQNLERVEGDKAHILNRIKELINNDFSYWVEVEYSGKDIEPDLQSDLDSLVQGSKVEILAVKNRVLYNRVLNIPIVENLETMGVADVFTKCLEVNNISEEDKPLLTQLFLNALNIVEERVG